MDINVLTPIPPDASSTEPGDLYCDLQTRTLWLGVDEAQDPAGAVLISDIAGMLAYADQAEADAKAYADSKLALKAPLASPTFTGTPTAPTAAVATNNTQLATTAFVKSAVAANTGQFIVGMIILWSGALTAVPAGWKLCDGANGTPNLRDHFVIGAGTKQVGTTNPNTSVATDLDGAHTPVIGATALSLANIPAHTHTFSDSFTTAAGGVTHTHAASLSGSTDTEAAHVHATNITTGTAGTGIHSKGDSMASSGMINTGSGGAHNHSVSVSGNTGSASAYSHSHTGTISGTTSAAGSGTAHSHTATAVAAHNHAITSTNLREAIPYYALAYIMKV